MSDLIDNNRFAPPKAELVEPASLAEGPVLAGRGLRFVAVLLDGLLMSLIAYPLFFVFGGSSMFMHPDAAAMQDPFAMMRAMFVAMVPGYIVVVIIQAWCLHAYGGTLAKKIMGLRIVRTDGSRAGFVRLFFGRGAAAVLPSCIPLLGSLWALVDSLLIFRESRQCLHDQIADTLVVTAASSQGASLEATRAR
ncbi:RDD family protein [Scleromatobacter humisilvae]|uniref:RDD family protein n=1 Tax=Scleromatobacter humisilvae TaxID=2897159 RepID=A0A9X1YM33_9BURK|nr:RDD family protein [Scleromatobacter humisilvae]MCK9688272.1 RDD family protein [Scleromatobacter humisilvae]